MNSIDTLPDFAVRLSGVFTPDVWAETRPVTFYTGTCKECARPYRPTKWAIRWHRLIRRHDVAYRSPEATVTFTSEVDCGNWERFR